MPIGPFLSPVGPSGIEWRRLQSFDGHGAHEGWQWQGGHVVGTRWEEKTILEKCLVLYVLYNIQNLKLYYTVSASFQMWGCMNIFGTLTGSITCLPGQKNLHIQSSDPHTAQRYPHLWAVPIQLFAKKFWNFLHHYNH